MISEESPEQQPLHQYSPMEEKYKFFYDSFQAQMVIVISLGTVLAFFVTTASSEIQFNFQFAEYQNIPLIITYYSFSLPMAV